MRINTNVSSLVARESATNTNNSLSSSLEKLSSGLAINKAADNASGLAIADKLRTQSTSIDSGIANGNSAVTLLQIADKSMAEQSNILDTIKAKLIQANSDSTSPDGRESIRKDIVKLLEQLDNIAEQTNYNGNVLLQSSATDTASSDVLSFQIGESTNDMISTTAVQSNTEGLGGGANKITSGAAVVTTGANVIDSGASMELKQASASGITVNTRNASGGAVNEEVRVSGEIGKVSVTTGVLVLSNVDAETQKLLNVMDANAASGGVITVSGTGSSAVYTIASGTSLDFGDSKVASMDIKVSGTTATGTGIKFETSETIKVKNLNTLATGNTTITGNDIVGGDLLSSLAALGEGELTKDKAAEFESVVDNAISDLNAYRGDIGSTQNQVESALRNLATQSTNIKAAESVIRDVDYAAESANFNKLNIIAQAGSYAISQANTVQQNVLKLLQ